MNTTVLMSDSPPRYVTHEAMQYQLKKLDIHLPWHLLHILLVSHQGEEWTTAGQDSEFAKLKVAALITANI